jgi:saccharopine dehydrogenase-like NADP-dependent oxidoreductase
MSYLILGAAGQQGRTITKYLREVQSEKVTTLDIVGDVDTTLHYDIWIKKQSKPPTVIVSCLRPTYSQGLIDYCHHNDIKGFLDLGGSDQITDAIRKTKTNYQYTAVLDVGLAPGLPSAIASKAVRENKRNVSVFIGGIPEKIEDEYVRSFSVDGLLGEYFSTAKFIRNGKIVYIPTLVERVGPFRFNNLQGAPTSGGLSFTPEVMLGKLDTLEYFTLRRLGYWNKFIKEILWRPDAKYVIEKCYPEVGPEHPDKVIVMIYIDKKWTIWEWSYDYENNISAMSQATGYIAGAVATMIHDNLIPKGINGMHDVDLDEVITRAKKMPNQFVEK